MSTPLDSRHPGDSRSRRSSQVSMTSPSSNPSHQAATRRVNSPPTRQQQQRENSLLRLPAEEVQTNAYTQLLHKILFHVGFRQPEALAPLAAVCRDLHTFVYNNPDAALWRDLLLVDWDDPRTAGGGTRNSDEIDWRKRVQDRVRLRRLFPRTPPMDTPERLLLEGQFHEEVASLPPPGAWFAPALDDSTDFIEQPMSGIRTFLIEDLHQHLDFICDTISDIYHDIPGQDLDKEGVMRTTMNGSFLTGLLDHSHFRDLYLDCVTDIKFNIRQSARQAGVEAGAQSTFSAGGSGSTTPKEFLALDTRYAPLHSRPPRGSTEAHLVTAHARIAQWNSLRAIPIEGFDGEAAYRGFLRELVYGARHYRPDNDYGPLNPDGSVDWHLLNACATIMACNRDEVSAVGDFGFGPRSWVPAIDAARGMGFRDLTRPATLGPNDVWDWAGAAGEWSSCYAFLNFADWSILNHPEEHHIRDLDLEHYMEAVSETAGMNVSVSHDPNAASAAYSAMTGRQITLAPLDTPLPFSTRLPPVYFHGIGRLADSEMEELEVVESASFVRGVARLTTDDPPELRWSLIIRYSDEDRWKIEGVQIGGRGSFRGFVGIWTECVRHRNSPNGPVWYWKNRPRHITYGHDANE